MKKVSAYASLIVLFVGMLAAACKQEVSPATELPFISFNQKVMPIIAANCTAAGCHGTENREEFSLLTYNDVLHRVEPSNPGGSELYRVIKTPTGGVMPPPPAEPLTDQQIALIYLWILQGAKNN